MINKKLLIIFWNYLDEEVIIMVLNNEEMLKINGGAVLSSFSLAALIGGAIIFLIGYFDGLINPKKCG